MTLILFDYALSAMKPSSGSPVSYLVQALEQNGHSGKVSDCVVDFLRLLYKISIDGLSRSNSRLHSLLKL